LKGNWKFLPERLAKLVLAPSQKKAALELHQPLEKLNKNVQNWSNSLFFIWFYHATQSIQPSLISRASDPLDKLTQDSKQRVAQIEARLKNHLTESELSAAQDEITRKVAHFRNLFWFIAFSNHP